MKIILLGSIPKGDKVRDNWIDWKTEYIEKISKAIPKASFLHGDLISDCTRDTNGKTVQETSYCYNS